MAELTLYLDNNLYVSFTIDETSTEDFLNEVLTDQGIPYEYDGNKELIIDALLSYHSDGGGSPHCDDFSITSYEYDSDSKMGKVELSYNISYSFTCSDMDSIEYHHLTVKFTIDVINDVFKMYFIDNEARSTLDEF